MRTDLDINNGFCLQWLQLNKNTALEQLLNNFASLLLFETIKPLIKYMSRNIMLLVKIILPQATLLPLFEQGQHCFAIFSCKRILEILDYKYPGIELLKQWRVRRSLTTKLLGLYGQVGLAGSTHSEK